MIQTSTIRLISWAPILFLAFLLLGATAPAQDWELVWSDEFDAPSLDLSNWNFEVNCDGGGNNELQCYTSRALNVRVENGMLAIVARRENYLGHNYTSGRITTANKRDFLYGRIEARIKIPHGQGYWPAFWMMPTDSHYGGWPVSGEIDIMESVNEMDFIGNTIHFGDFWPNNTNTGCTLDNGTIFSDDFHTYAIEWRHGRIDWFVDGVLTCTRIGPQWFTVNGPNPAPFDERFFIILNVAVGGTWPGDPSPVTVFPQSMLVDYVRVYQKPNAPPTGTLSPASESTLPSGPIAMSVQASDSDGTVERVQFWGAPAGQPLEYLGDDHTAPFAFDWSPGDGCYDLMAKIVDDDGANVRVHSRTIMLGPACRRDPFHGTPHAIPGVIEAEDFDLGRNGVAYFDEDPGNSGNAYRLSVDVDIEPSSYTGNPPAAGDDYNIGYVRTGEWLGYTVDVAQSGEYRLDAVVASLTRGGRFHLEVDGEDVTGTIGFPATGGWQNWTTVGVSGVPISAGPHFVKVVSEDFDFNYQKFTFTFERPLTERPSDYFFLY